MGILKNRKVETGLPFSSSIFNRMFRRLFGCDRTLIIWGWISNTKDLHSKTGMDPNFLPYNTTGYEE